MNKDYLKLFLELSHSIEAITEKAIEEEKEAKDDKAFKAAISMRKIYMELTNKLQSKNPTLDRSDYGALLIGAGIMLKNLEEKKAVLDKAISGYKIMLLPKLNRILNETNNDVDAVKLAEKLFSSIDEEN
jgi:hypothetical protein